MQTTATTTPHLSVESMFYTVAQVTADSHQEAVARVARIVHANHTDRETFISDYIGLENAIGGIVIGNKSIASTLIPPARRYAEAFIAVNRAETAKAEATSWYCSRATDDREAAELKEAGNYITRLSRLAILHQAFDYAKAAKTRQTR